MLQLAPSQLAAVHVFGCQRRLHVQAHLWQNQYPQPTLLPAAALPTGFGRLESRMKRAFKSDKISWQGSHGFGRSYLSCNCCVSALSGRPSQAAGKSCAAFARLKLLAPRSFAGSCTPAHTSGASRTDTLQCCCTTFKATLSAVKAWYDASYKLNTIWSCASV